MNLIRIWNYIEVNVTRNELEEQLNEHLKHLIHPLNTILDESIGSAFWFAARGQGYHIEQDRAFKCPARVSMELITIHGTISL